MTPRKQRSKPADTPKPARETWGTKTEKTQTSAKKVKRIKNVEKVERVEKLQPPQPAAVAEAPEATTARKAPKAPRARKSPTTVQASKASRAAKAGQAPEVGQGPEALQPPPRPQPPEAPQTPQAPQLSTAPQPLRILMISSEAVPFSKTGGLADVSSALSRALARMGHDVTLITPRYRGVTDGTPRHQVRAFVAGTWFDATLRAAALGDGATALLVDCPTLYDRSGIYFENNIDYPDNAVRFAFLSIAALDWAAAQATPPSIVHIHDWQTGLTPIYAQQSFAQLQLPFVLTIHNLAYQGIFAKGWVPSLGLRWEDFTVQGFEFYDQLNFLKAGINRSDALTTVSPTYAKEIQRPEYGYGLDGVIRARADALTGILNGIDIDEWDPSKDTHLPAPFDAENLGGKSAVKRALLEAFGLPSDAAAMTRPVIGMVSRLVDQKGMDLIEAVAPVFPTLDASFVVVGSGHPRYEQMWRSLAAAHPDRVGAFIGFAEDWAHLVEGGADMFLMPSFYEPCGLNQMYSLRYGTVPIVRAVGGLVDTVEPFDASRGHGTGFLFSAYDPAALLAAVQQALDVYKQPLAWRRVQENGMGEDFSWERSAAAYARLYRDVLRRRLGA